MTYKNTLYACYIGYITQAIVVNFMPILFVVFNEDYNISLSSLGTLVLINFVAQIITDIIATRSVDRLGFRRSAVPAHVCAQRIGTYYVRCASVGYEQYIHCACYIGYNIFCGRRTYRGGCQPDCGSASCG